MFGVVCVFFVPREKSMPLHDIGSFMACSCAHAHIYNISPQLIFYCSQYTFSSFDAFGFLLFAHVEIYRSIDEKIINRKSKRRILFIPFTFIDILYCCAINIYTMHTEWMNELMRSRVNTNWLRKCSVFRLVTREILRKYEFK